MPKPFLIPITPKRPIVGMDPGAVTSRMSKLGLDIVRAAAQYPPARTRYRRTGTLGRSWVKEGPTRVGKDLVVKIGNKTKYARPVMGLSSGSDAQMALFKGLGWKSIQVIGEKEIEKARPEIEKLLQGK